MKTASLTFFLSILSASTLTAADIEWAPNAPDNNWSNPANWAPPGAPTVNSTIVFSENSSNRSPILSGVTGSMEGIVFSDNASTYDIQLRQGSNLTLTGNGIINNTPAASGGIEGQVFRIKDGSSLIFANNASADTVRIVNYEGSLVFKDNATAGSAYISSSGPTHGGPLLQMVFTDNSNAGNANIINYGGNSVLLFEKNATSGSAAIFNRGNSSQVIFTDHAALEGDAKIANNGRDAITLFEGNSSITGNSAARDIILNSSSSTSAAVRNQFTGNAILVNNGSFATMTLGGNSYAKDAIISNNGAFSVLQITDGFKAEGTFAILNTMTSSRVSIIGNETSKVVLDCEKFYFLNYSNNTSFYIGNNVTINASKGGNFFNGGSGELSPVTFTIGGNAEVNSTGSDALYFRVSSTSNAHFLITDNAVINNVYIAVQGGNASAIATDIRFIIGGNATFTTNRLTLLATHSGTLQITDNATFNSTSQDIRVNGTDSNFIVDGNANFTYGNRIFVNGTNATFTVGGNATFDGTRMFANGTNARYVITDNSNFSANEAIINGSNSSYIITGNANFTANTIRLNATSNNPDGGSLYIGGNANATLLAANGLNATGPGSLVHITDNATVNIRSTLRNIADNATLGAPAFLIDGNAKLIGNGSSYMQSIANGNAVTIAGNATVSGIQLRLINNSANKVESSIVLAGTPTLTDVSVWLGGNGSRGDSSSLLLALDEGHSVNLKTLQFSRNTTDPERVIHFFGGNNQTFSYDELVIDADHNLSITQDGAGRGAFIHNASATLNLTRANSFRGDLTALQGTINLQHEDAASTLTLNFTTTGAINFDTSLPSDLTLGGIMGDGEFNLGTRNFNIGANDYDNTFSGNLIGSGNITKTGNGVLTFSGDTSGYIGSTITVEQGTLGLSGSQLSSTDLTLNANTALRIGQGQTLIKNLSLQADAILDVAVSKSNGDISNGNLQFSDLSGDTFTDLVYRATVADGSEILAQGDMIENFATTTDSAIVAEINAEGGNKDYGKVRSTNTRSFNLYGEATASTANLSLEVLTNSLADYASNPNQASIAGALDHIIQNHPNDDLAIAADTAPDPREVIDSINPAGLSSMARLVYRQTNAEIDVISSRLDMQRHLNSALRQNGQISDAILRVSSSIQSFQIPAAMLTASTKPIPTPGAKASEEALPYQQTFWSGYLAGTASFGKMDADKDAAGYDYQQAGITLGLDKTIGVNEGIAGFQLSYHHGKSDLDKPSEGHVKLNSLRLAGYAGFLTRSGLSTQAHIALSYHDYESERLSFDNGYTMGLNKGDTDGYGAALSGELAKVFTPARQLQWKHGPYARLTYDWLSIKGYDEQGTVTALHIDKQTPDSLRSTLGWKLWYENISPSGNVFLFNARLGWAHEFSNPNQSISARFSQYDAGFTVRGPNTRRDSLAYGLSTQWLFASGRFITLQYQGDLNDDQSTHFINASLGWKF